MRNINMTLCAMALAAVSTTGFAASKGEVRFTGELIAETCTITTGYETQTVPLPKVSVQTLNAANIEAGSKGFDLKVENCPSAITKVGAHFEAVGSTGVNSVTNNLTNNYTPSGANDKKANNVEIRLYNADAATQLKLGDTGAMFDVSSTGTATMRYYGGYYSTGVTTLGKVAATAKYTLAYP
ncbi:fimbrial protein [Intestinirhabdus alba]|jgi:major type 1 subunit fimbrin (pilin)|uniref:Fimbrial protein n=1 Tax=Intestinirhabdus alba TaxID=2899544 RepID=A0A6L6ILU6_9ENTR|nr:fimbrial protein [Intestinirhabdus alba]MTH46698.1 fimbrial protein [Intestinirhabdus alba]